VTPDLPRAPLRRRPSRCRRATALAVTAVLAAAVALVPGPAAAATPVVSASGLTASVSGTTVTASAGFTAQPWTAGVTYGICIANAAGTRFDLTPWTGALGASPSNYRGSRTLAAGSYQYAACVKGPAGWVQLGSAKTLSVAGAVSAPASSTAMPKGDLPGWRQVSADDFTTAVPLGSFPGSTYRSRYFTYGGYADTSGRGWYDPAKVLSVKDGMLDWYIHTSGGMPRVSAVVPRIPSTGWGQTYGRYSVRFRSDTIKGYKMVAMLWPDSDNWGEGEIDFMETGHLAGAKIYANMYPKGNRATGTPGTPTGFRTQVAADGNGWHVATVEWAPGSVTYWLDGTKLGTSTNGVPSTSMHMVFQVETTVDLAAPASTVAGHVQVDWIVQYARAG